MCTLVACGIAANDEAVSPEESPSGDRDAGPSGAPPPGVGVSSSQDASSSDGASPGGDGGDASSSGNPARAPWLVQCFYGAAAFGFNASNPEIEAACKALPYAKVATCQQADCQVGWDFLKRDDAYKALFAALDSNGDNKVDDADAEVSIALMGHSWGGTNVAQIGESLRDDNRVTPSRKKIELAVVWDPFRPAFKLAPSANFARFVVLRQSLSPSGDCSEKVGSFKGLPPRCPAGQLCEDYNYSQSPDDSFPMYPSGSLYGDEVGHCAVFNVGFPVAKALLEGTTPVLPASVPVQAP